MLVHDSGRLPLGLGEDDVDEVLGRRDHGDLLEVVLHHLEGKSKEFWPENIWGNSRVGLFSTFPPRAMFSSSAAVDSLRAARKNRSKSRACYASSHVSEKPRPFYDFRSYAAVIRAYNLIGVHIFCNNAVCL